MPGASLRASQPTTPHSHSTASVHTLGGNCRTRQEDAAQKFLSLAADVDLSMGIELVSPDECQEALVRLAHGQTTEPNLVVGGWG